MVAPGPGSEVNREYFAQNNEREIEEGRGLEGYEKTDEKARDLLRRLANSEPHYKKQRRLEAESAAEAEEGGGSGGGPKMLEAGGSGQHTPGPMRTAKSAYGSSPYGAPSSSRTPGKSTSRPSNRGFPSSAALPPKPEDIAPPADPNITSLFLTGVEDDLPEHAIRAHFEAFGTLRSVVCSHRSHCAFMNYAKRADAEKAAEACQGRAVVKGVPLRVQWGKPKPLDSMERERRMENARAGRQQQAGGKKVGGGAAGSGKGRDATANSASKSGGQDLDALVAAPPPGQGDVEYAAQAGE
ncbi:Pre-mRNA-splicing factor [Hortaea werneckii]|nr:Pre-mRNA-splicing factor [Hortaea werneckii]KAI7279946.1 Pre-mRNA-splicing factor [Hortaea werneckii]